MPISGKRIEFLYRFSITNHKFVESKMLSPSKDVDREIIDDEMVDYGNIDDSANEE